jgi:tetraacyldisaccharide 4'-kinase
MSLGAIYGRIARLRRSWYERHPSAQRQLARPVISVGNLAVGGSGKTPVVAALARLLQSMGERPAVLSRGYARRREAEGVVVVSDGNRVLAAVDASGDEPQMLARALRNVPVLVARERYLAGVLAERQLGATVHILDDGFQHLQMARTIDLLLMSPEDLHDRVLPSGRLREPLSAAHRADAVLVRGSADDAARVAGALGVGTTFTIAARYGRLETFAGTGTPDGRRVVGVAGIARPHRFFSALRHEGFDLLRELTFPDHHWYSASDAARIVAMAHEAGADAIVTTAKDAVRLETLLAGKNDMPWAVLPMDVTIEPAPAFLTWLEDRLASQTRVQS